MTVSAVLAMVLCLALRGIAVSEIFALRDDMVGDVPGVVPDAPDERGTTARQPRQTEEIDAGLLRHASLMFRLALFVEGIDLQPTEIHRIAGCPDDRGHAGLCQVEFENGMGRAFA